MHTHARGLKEEWGGGGLIFLLVRIRIRTCTNARGWGGRAVGMNGVTYHAVCRFGICVRPPSLFDDSHGPVQPSTALRG